jgi:hypothetical protein
MATIVKTELLGLSVDFMFSGSNASANKIDGSDSKDLAKAKPIPTGDELAKMLSDHYQKS